MEKSWNRTNLRNAKGIAYYIRANLVVTIKFSKTIETTFTSGVMIFLNWSFKIVHLIKKYDKSLTLSYLELLFIYSN